MRKFLFLFSLVFIFTACDKDFTFEKTYRDSSLWINIDKHIKDLTITYAVKNHKGKSTPCEVRCDSGVITPMLDVDLRSGKTWTEVYEGQAESTELAITYKDKKYVVKGFGFGESRFIEVILTYTGEIRVIAYDIETVDTIVNI